MQTSSVGEWMKERRRALKLTQLELADHVGASLETIQKLETGKRRPSRQMAQLLADRLGLTEGERAIFVELARSSEDSRGAGVFTHSELPRQLTSFVGREREVAELRALVESHQLVTLTGTGGTGKTRLAVAVAQEVQHSFPDGVLFVDLAPLSEPQQVAPAVAAALGLQDQPGRGPLEAIQSYLRMRHTLLLLDNCEHLLEASSRLVDTCLRACPQLHVLATSRQPLSLHYELARVVPPLALPERYAPAAVDSLSTYSAIELFLQRARHHLPGFSLTEGNGQSIVEVCKRLDGLPLAIELAAARVNVLSVQQIAGRLNERFRLLTGGSAHSMPARQRTLRTTLDWSYQLLSAAEQRLLKRLSVFADTFDLEAVHSVCGEDEYETIDLLAGLVEKSLLMRSDPDGRPGYRLLETIREYAWEKLQEDGESTAVRNRHLNWCVQLAEQAAPKLKGREQLEWLARLEQESANLQAALAWSLSEGGAPEMGLRLATALGWFWQMRGYLVEGLSWFGELLALPKNLARTALRCEALFQAGALAWEQHSLALARSFMDECYEIAGELGDALSIARATSGQTMLTDFEGHKERARSLGGQVLEMYAELGMPWNVGWNLTGRVSIAQGLGELDSAAVQAEENVILFNELGDAWAAAINLIYWGIVLYQQGLYGSARDKLKQGLAINERLGDRSRAIWAVQWLARCALAERDYELAAGLYRRVLASYGELGDKHYVFHGARGIARIVEQRGDLHNAAILTGAVMALDPDHYPAAYIPDGAPAGPVEPHMQAPPAHEPSPSAVARVRAMSMEELVDYALRIVVASGTEYSREEPTRTDVKKSHRG